MRGGVQGLSITGGAVMQVLIEGPRQSVEEVRSPESINLIRKSYQIYNALSNPPLTNTQPAEEVRSPETIRVIQSD
jgi:hypothetical protein